MRKDAIETSNILFSANCFVDCVQLIVARTILLTRMSRLQRSLSDNNTIYLYSPENLNCFKNVLDKFWSQQEINFDWKVEILRPGCRNT